MVTLMLLGYATFVLVITLSPRMPGSGTVGRLVDRVLASLHARGLIENVDYLVVEFLGNILMFVPLGVFTAMLLSRRHWWVLLFLGTLFSGRDWREAGRNGSQGEWTTASSSSA